MSKLMIVILTLAFAGCDYFKSKKEIGPITPENPATPATLPDAVNDPDPKAEPQLKAEANRDCETAHLGHPQSKATFKMKNEVEFILCEADELKELESGTYSGWGNLYQKKDQRKDQLTPILPEVKGEKPNDFYSFRFQKKSDTEIVIYRQVMNASPDVGGEQVTITERKITCTKPNECEIGKETCIDFKKTFKVDKKSIEKVQEVVSGKLKVEEAGYYDVAIGGVINSVLAGDPIAKKLMFDTSKKKLKVDGAAAESYEDGKGMLTVIRKLKCL